MPLEIGVCQQGGSTEKRNASNSSSNNNVCASVIAESEATGVRLGQSWPHMSCGRTGAMTSAMGHTSRRIVRRESEMHHSPVLVHLSRRGTKRRGSDSAVMLMTADGSLAAQGVYRASTTAATTAVMAAAAAATSASVQAMGSKRKRSLDAGDGLRPAKGRSVPSSMTAASSEGRWATATSSDVCEPCGANGTCDSSEAAPSPVLLPPPLPVPLPLPMARVRVSTVRMPRSAVAIPAPTPLSTLPPVNRYTLRELKIQNILQNPRLRHEVLFEPKLEFRPNSSGQLAEAKQRAAQQYWSAVEQSLHGESGATTIAMLVIELREIVAEIAEDTGKTELAQHAMDLRERLDDARVQQQLLRNTFDVGAAISVLGDTMLVLAPAERHSVAIARISACVARGRMVRGLRLAFDMLEGVKIDIANSSIDMYREYMRATAVAFERSHFALAVRRGAVAGLTASRGWWQRALADARGSGASADAVFFEAARELVLDDGVPLPALFRMDDVRIAAMRREAERLSVAGTIFLSFMQFLQAASRNQSQIKLQTPEFRTAIGRVDHGLLAAECLSMLPEACTVRWTEPLRANVATPDVSAAVPAVPGEVTLSRLVADLLCLAYRALGRTVLPAEAAILERTLLRAARYECPLREVVEERVNAALRSHTNSLADTRTKAHGTECDSMPQGAMDALQRAQLHFLLPALSALSMRIHAVLAHHWLVYKLFYASPKVSAEAASVVIS
ncbi:cAMP-mediated signaling protein sok1 [Kickxella alabastrina]|uniref:cAMP-mediated signaling protein sok1 n=1 Tax=Kickxella alabastrina TaxID=61397 RepID=A0ACC1IGT1_9FUNG|nr:cAMP-mediated signaling protein sok1 [Kickxella alabastrina]